MNIIIELRRLTGLTGEQVAQFTDLSRSAVTMAESGLRELPPDALVKVTRLLQAAQAAANQLPPPPMPTKEKHRRHAIKLEAHAAKCRLKAEALQKRLDYHRQQQQNGAVLAATLKQLQTTWKDASADDKLWMGAMKAIQNIKTRRQDAIDRHTMEWELEKLEAQATAAEKRATAVRKKMQ